MTGQESTKVVTRADVARLAGVSTAVVSYVVNGGPRPVAAETATRVKDAIDLLGYRPNAIARALKLGTTGVLGLVVPDSSNPFYAEFGLEIERAATARGLALLMASSNSDLELEARLIGDMSGRQLDGLMVSGVAGPAIPGLRGVPRVSAPIVYLDSPVMVPGHTTLCSDAQTGAVAPHRTSDENPRTPAGCVGDGNAFAAVARRPGGRLAARRRNRPTSGRPSAARPVHPTGRVRGGRALLSGRDRPTAVFASSDLQAVGLLRAAHELGIRVPEDLAVVAYDGTEEAEFSWPPLTCAQQRVGEIAESAVRVIVEREPASHRVFDVDLALRRSCGCPGT